MPDGVLAYGYVPNDFFSGLETTLIYDYGN